MKIRVHQIIMVKSGSILLCNLARGERRRVQFRVEEITYSVEHDGGSFIDKFSRLNRVSSIVPNGHDDSTLSQMTEYRDG